MMRGVVTELRPTVNVTLRLPNYPDFAIEFVIDTAFQGALTLPPEAIATLGLPFLSETHTNLANNTVHRANTHLAAVMWQQQEVQVIVVALGRRPLLGTALLRGCELFVNFEEGGEVIITQRSQSPPP